MLLNVFFSYFHVHDVSYAAATLPVRYATLPVRCRYALPSPLHATSRLRASKSTWFSLEWRVIMPLLPLLTQPARPRKFEPAPADLCRNPQPARSATESTGTLLDTRMGRGSGGQRSQTLRIIVIPTTTAVLRSTTSRNLRGRTGSFQNWASPASFGLVSAVLSCLCRRGFPF